MRPVHIHAALVEQRVLELLAKAGAPGAAVALVVDGEPLYQGGVGFRDLARTEPVAADARFYIYSLTKMMIAVAVLQRVEAGKLNLDAPMQTMIQELRLERPITVRQLLNHTSGLPDYGTLPAYHSAVRRRPREPWTAQAFLSNTLERGLLFAPGEGWAYSNIGYMLLAQLLEQQVGATLASLLRRQIFAACAADGMRVAQSLEDAQALTPGYTSFFSQDGSLEDMRSRYHPGWVAHGVVMATAGEVARFMETLFGGRLLSAPLLKQMSEPRPVAVTHPHFARPAYGLGLMIDAQEGKGLIAGHGGGGPGYSAAACTFFDVRGKRVIGVALVNCDRADAAMDIVFALRSVVVDQA